MALIVLVEDFILGEETVRRTERKRVENLKNGKAAGKNEVTGKMIKREGELVINWIWKLHYIGFEE